MASNDIPPQCRGTIRFGKNPQPWHFERSDQSGQLFIRMGEDLRDWDKITSGALDYSHIAFQEHAAKPVGEKFKGHAGEIIRLACAECAAAENRTQQIEYIVPETVPPEVQAANDQHAAQLAAEAEQARKDAALKASLPPSREVLADQAALNRVKELEALVASLQAGTTETSGGPYTSGQTFTTAPVTLNLTADDLSPHPLPAEEQIAAADDLRPTHGTDPWTGETVPIYWNIDGASPTHPYGAKKDGTPRRLAGNKTNAQRAEEAATE